ncbi:ABC transporter ATP-binding protein [Sutcliffiella horikoshii]|uniref:ABC transporter ATP-binding protein n=1 Tax=Sutcliffiella horikoshii TaxID=79883 RepID=UPI001CFD60BE|nr:ATP-binding cassette domain-containing protein [Sutcliffiella horikoshii]
MLKQIIKDESAISKEVVLSIKKLGVTYNSGYKKDDFKSHLFGIGRKKKKNTNKIIWPLKEISFEGYKGEILGIIGSNGAGKTTLCKIISGILKPDKGELYVDGTVSALFSLGMGFNKELTGRENVYLNGMMLGISKEKIHGFIDEIHEFSGIGDFIDQPIKKYSSGMKARLGFSVAAFLEPEILILDEALNTGDLAFSERASVKMKELVSKAKMVILVTHSLNFAKENCDRLIWLEQGGIRDIGEPESIIADYEATVPKPKRKVKKGLNLQKTEANIKEKTVVKADNINVTYNMNGKTFSALNDVSFTINEGEIVGIIGHNGAGKSTLCKVLTNILTPEQGDLKLNGSTTALLGYGTGFNAQLTGKDNIYLNGMLLGIPKKKVEREYQNIVNFSELGKNIHRPVKQYSSGMRARLGFSIAAILQPDIFIIDEALSTGDMEFNQKASEKIQEMIEQAKAVIIVSHSMSFVEKVCTRAIWVEKGKIILDGDSKEVVNQYKETVSKKKK